jgi:hypothetical protein
LAAIGVEIFLGACEYYGESNIITCLIVAIESPLELRSRILRIELKGK